MVSDMGLVPGASGEPLVSEVVQKIQDSMIFPNDYGLLERIAIVESNSGRHPSTYDGVYGGIWQVDPIGFKETQEYWSHSGFKTFYPKIKEHFGIDWPQVTFEDLRKPLYSALAARIYLLSQPERIPRTLERQAKYWKKYYNTSPDRGSEDDFIDRVLAAEGNN